MRGFGSATLGLTALLALSASSCRDGTGVFVPQPDASTGPLTCSSTADCGGVGICVAGLCQEVRSCTVDDECASDNKVCHTNRFYCVECDGTHPGECPMGQTCQFDFTCVPIGGGMDAGTSTTTACSGNCTDRGECGPDQVCKDSQCCPPPPRCASPQDCPSSAPQCNGATGQCFGGQSCILDTDCDNMGGCAPGTCRCDGMNGQPGSCVLRDNECDEDSDCLMSGQFCAKLQTPRLCLMAPLCMGDAQCANQGLVCDTNAGHCVNGMACSQGSGCPGNQVCINDVCTAQSCVTNPGLCNAMETCDQATGTCIPAQGGSCTTDNDCQAGFYCETMIAQPECRVGCRDNADCSGGVCNAAHQCEFPMGGICGPCTTDMDCPAGTTCGMLSGKCVETCNPISGGGCSDPMTDCILFICPCGL